MMKWALALAAATAALLVAGFAVATRREKRAARELKGEIRRWEEEGGSIATPLPDTSPPSAT